MQTWEMGLWQRLIQWTPFFDPYTRLLTLPLIRAASQFGKKAVREETNHLSAFCFFIGFPRSGHSLIGSILSAHPEIVISHELDALYFVERGLDAHQIFGLILARDRAFSRAGRRWTDYDYAIAGAGQGTYGHLRIIGDKKGGKSSERLQRNPKLIQRLRETVEVPLRTVHIVRNPFDNIATIHNRGGIPLSDAIGRYQSLCEANRLIRDLLEPEELLELRLESIIGDPAHELDRLCTFLGVSLEPDFLNSCLPLLFKAPRKTRETIRWPASSLERVSAMIESFEFLEGYEW